MGTYEQVLNDYAAGKITPEMAVGHSLQDVENLYEEQHIASTHRYKLQNQVTDIEHTLKLLQTQIAQLQKTTANKCK